MSKIVTSKLSQQESSCFSKLLNDSSKIFCTSQLSGMSKVHKNKVSVSIQSVVSQVGSLDGITSTCLDFKLQPLYSLVPSSVKASQYVINKLHIIDTLPTNAKLFTTDAVSMYTDIYPDGGVFIITKFLRFFTHNTFTPSKCDVIIDLLKLFMRNYTFKFGDTWLLQILVKIWAPPVCAYILFYSLSAMKMLSSYGNTKRTFFYTFNK